LSGGGPHPSDRRAKARRGDAQGQGHGTARRDEILGHTAAGAQRASSTDDLEALRRILELVTA